MIRTLMACVLLLLTGCSEPTGIESKDAGTSNTDEIYVCVVVERLVANASGGKKDSQDAVLSQFQAIRRVSPN